jgi:hypothetical protein
MRKEPVMSDSIPIPALKAERIQLLIAVAASRPEAPQGPPPGDRSARARRVLAGWRRRTSGPRWRPRSDPHAA